MVTRKMLAMWYALIVVFDVALAIKVVTSWPNFSIKKTNNSEAPINGASVKRSDHLPRVIWEPLIQKAMPPKRMNNRLTQSALNGSAFGSSERSFRETTVLNRK